MPDVVLPCLDEAAALPGVLAGLPPGYVATVADNGSSDGSAQVARALGAHVVDVPRRGFGAAVHAGLEAVAARHAAGAGRGGEHDHHGDGDGAARDDGTDDGVVCVVDADGSFDLAELPRVAGPVLAGEADLVLGARRPVSWRSWPLHARLANRVLARRLRAGSGLDLSDLGPMRAARREVLLALPVTDRRSGYPLEQVVAAAAAGLRVREVPVAYAPRAAGTHSKVTGTVRGTITAVRDMSAVLRRASADAARAISGTDERPAGSSAGGTGATVAAQRTTGTGGG